MPTHDNEQANARRRVVYAQNIDKNNKKHHLIYRVARLSVDMSSSIPLSQHSDRPSLPSPMLNPLNTRLNDAHQRFHKKWTNCMICMSTQFANNVTLVL